MGCWYCSAGQCGADVHLTQGDLGPPLSKTIYGPDGRTPQDLTGATVTLEIQHADLSGLVFGGSCAIVGAPTLGVAQYTWQSGDSAVPGLYRFKFKLVYAGVPSHYPNNGSFSLRIVPDLLSTAQPPPDGSPVMSDPSLSPGLNLPIGYRVLALDGSAAWDKFGPGATDWQLVGTDQTARSAATAAQTTANTAITAAAAAEVDGEAALTAAAAADADAQTAINAAAAAQIQRFATIAAMASYAGAGVEARCLDVRDRFYEDHLSGLAPDTISVVSGAGPRIWVRECLADIYWQQQTEFWLKAASGSDTASGARGFDLKTIGELIRRTNGSQSSAPCTLYTDAALSGSENALFTWYTSQSPRPWSIVNGALPEAVAGWWDAANFNAANNAGLVDGASPGSLWKNLGARGSALDAPLVTGAPIYRAIAAASKLRNSPAIEFNGSTYFRTAADGTLTGPSLLVTVFRISDGTVTNRVVDGNSTSCGFEFGIGNPPALILYAGSSSGLQAPLDHVTVGQYNAFQIAFNPAAGTSGFAVANINGETQLSQTPVGLGFCHGVTLGAWFDGSAPFKGQLVCHMLVDGAVPSLDSSAFSQFLQYRYGPGFPQ